MVLPLIAQPSARLEADETLPPFFIIGSPGLPPVPGAGNPPPVVPIPGGLMPNIGGLPPVPGAGSGVGITAGAPVTVGLTPGLEGAAGNGLAGTFPGAYFII